MKSLVHYYDIVYSLDKTAIDDDNRSDEVLLLDLMYESRYEVDIAAEVIAKVVPGIERLNICYNITEVDTDDHDYWNPVSYAVVADKLVLSTGELVDYDDYEKETYNTFVS